MPNEIDLQKERADYFARGYNEGWESRTAYARKQVLAFGALCAMLGYLLARAVDLGFKLWGHG